MSEDRELVERLAAIEATPRARWVAELRADLDAAWDTGDAGYLDSLRTTTLTLVDHEPTPSEPSSDRRWLVLIAAAAAAVAAIALVATRDDDATPADQPTSTVPVPVPPSVPVPPPEWPAALAPELTAQPFEPPIACRPSPFPGCPGLAVSPDGTLVAWDTMTNTLTWYADEPRVIPLNVELPHGDDEDLQLIAIGPHDIAYLKTLDPPGFLLAVAPSGTEITRVDWATRTGPVYPAATGLVGMQYNSSAEWPPPDVALVMPWVDLDGNPITDTRPYPTAKNTDAGTEVRLGEHQWLLAGEALSPDSSPRFLLARSDGGVVMVLETLNGSGPSELLELLPDGTIERYVLDGTLISSYVRLPSAVLPDGSLVVEHDLQLVRLIPPT